MTDSEHRSRAQGHASTQPHEPRPVVPLGHDVRAIVEAPLLGDTFLKLFACELLDAAVGWPRLLAGATAPSDLRGWLRAGDVMIELAQAPASATPELGVSLSASSAVQLVDALLGGRVSSTLASASGQPSEAECGVLAYATARLLAASKQPWIVRDVRACEAHADATRRVVWPLALRTSRGTLDATIWVSRALAECQQARHQVAVVLPDQTEQHSLDRLAVGDVWICEGSSLTLTSEGLAGPVVLAVAGTAARLAAQLRRQRVRVRGPASPAHELDAAPFMRSAAAYAPLELVIGGTTLSLLELAELASGQAFDLCCNGAAEGALCRAGVTLARGELVTWRGAVGLRVLELGG